MNESDLVSTVDPRQHRQSWRLTFHFDRDQVQLASQQTIEMIAPAFVGPMPKAGEYCGTWLEIRDAGERVLFVRRLHNPFGTLAEHHSPTGKIEVATRPVGRGEFEAIVPAIDTAQTAVLMSSPMDDARSTQPAKEIGRFELRERPRTDPAGPQSPQPANPPTKPKGRGGRSS